MRRPTTLAALAVASLIGLGVVRLTVDPTPSPEAPAPAKAGPVEPLPGVIVRQARAAQSLPAEALHGIAFEDVTDEAGLGGERPSYVPDGAIQGMTSGAAVTELGGKTALLLTSPTGPIQLFEYDGSRFVDITADAGLADAGPATAAGFADLDGDDDPDLVLGHQNDRVASVLVNDGAGHFTDRTRRSGVVRTMVAPIDTAKAAIRGLAFGDVDGDGHFDFLTADANPIATVAAEEHPDVAPDEAACRTAAGLRELPESRTSQGRLYLGDGRGGFTDATDAWGLQLDAVFAYTPQLLDVDEDGRLDLLLASDVCTSRIYRNTGKRFLEVVPTVPMAPHGRGAVVRDFDGDGRPDWLVTGTSYPTETGECPHLNVISGCTGNRVFLGGEGFGFTDGTDDLGLRDSGWAAGVAVDDFGNTGDLQVAVTGGFHAGSGQPGDQWSTFYGTFDDDPLAFFVRGGEGPYVDAAEQVGLTDTGIGHALLSFDYDRDGRLDLLVNNSDIGPRLYRNVSATDGRHWVTVRAEFGARIRVTTASGKSTDGWLTSSTSYEAQALPELHVGLGDEAGPVRVEVWWPGEPKPRVERRVPVDQVVEIEPQTAR